MALRIFLSSTFVDLHDQRSVVNRAALATGWEPVYFDATPGLDTPQVLTRVHHDIRSCDAFANLLASRYGSQVPELVLSYTHFELALALRLGKPIVSLVLTESEMELRDKGWHSRYPAQDPTLMDLRNKVREIELGGACVRYEYSAHSGTAQSLRHAAEAALAEAKRRFVAGEFRHNSVHMPQMMRRQGPLLSPDRPPLASLSPRLVLDWDLSGLTRSWTRSQAFASAVKAEYARYFWDYNLPLISFQGVLNLFFSWGSSPIFLFRGLLEALEWTTLYGRARLRLLSNNLQLPEEIGKRFEELKCELDLAPGQVVPKYAATTGGDVFDVWVRSRLSHMLDTERGLIIGGASVPARGRRPSLQSESFGRLLNEASNEKNWAGVLFFNATTRPDDGDTEWLRAWLQAGSLISSRPLPLAICIGGGSRERREAFALLLTEWGLEPIPPTYHDGEYKTTWPVFATNRAFRDMFGQLIG